MVLTNNKKVHRRGHRGARKVMFGFNGVMPRVHYKVAGEKFLLCFKSRHGSDKVIGTVHDPRTAKNVCNLINDLRLKVSELEALNANLCENISAGMSAV